MSRKDLSYVHGRCQELLAAAGNSRQLLRLDFVSAVSRIRSFNFLEGSAVLQGMTVLFQRNPIVSICVLFLSCKANASVYLAKTGHGPYSS